jgi:hypothetical protein
MDLTNKVLTNEMAKWLNSHNDLPLPELLWEFRIFFQLNNQSAQCLYNQWLYS